MVLCHAVQVHAALPAPLHDESHFSRQGSKSEGSDL